MLLWALEIRLSQGSGVVIIACLQNKWKFRHRRWSVHWQSLVFIVAIDICHRFRWQITFRSIRRPLLYSEILWKWAVDCSCVGSCSVRTTTRTFTHKFKLYFYIYCTTCYQRSLLLARTERFLWSYCKEKTESVWNNPQVISLLTPGIEPGPDWWEAVKLPTGLRQESDSTDN